jgi:cytochrome c-type biogenesis protein CcmE
MQKSINPGIQGRAKFIVGGLLILVAIVYLIYSSAVKSAEYFMTVNEIKSGGESLVDHPI